MKLVTSNPNKLAEFSRFGLDIEMAAGLDLKEVSGTSEQVAIYKAIEAGENLIVEDTILTIDGEEIVDIRQRLNELPQWEGKEAIWQTSIACMSNGEIKIAVGRTLGTIAPPEESHQTGFGFDPYFYPLGSQSSLSHLELIGEKDGVSARKQAITRFLSDEKCKTIPLCDIPQWTGDYQ
jgi:inosine/xanthosine triphosphate pyrophosphatase family protein